MACMLLAREQMLARMMSGASNNLPFCYSPSGGVYAL